MIFTNQHELHWFYHLFVDVKGRPGLGSSLLNALPILKWLNHLQYCVQFIQSFPYVCWRIFNVSVNVLLTLKQTLTQSRCSSKYFISTVVKIRLQVSLTCTFNPAWSVPTTVAVSYTHLDVYKRQSLTSIWISLGSLFRHILLLLV